MSVKLPSKFTFGIDLDGGLDIDIPQTYTIDIPTDFSVSIKQLAPIDLSVRLKELPSVRGHLPLNYKLGFNFLGRELACISLCGQGQFITEPYAPYPCEPRERQVSRPTPVPPNREPIG